jgi:hypothetical protein
MISGIIFHSKCSSSRNARFVFHQKAPSLETGVINQFAFKVNQFHFFGMWTCHNGFMVPKSIISIGSQISSHGVSSLVLTHFNFSGWFRGGHIVFGLIFSRTSSNSFCSALWKVTTISRSIFGYSNHFGLLACPTLALSCKTYSILFFIFLVNIVGIL